MSSLKATLQNNLLKEIVQEKLAQELKDLGFKFRKSKLDFRKVNDALDLNINLYKPYNFITYNSESNNVEIRVSMILIAFNKGYDEYLRGIHNKDNVKSKIQLDNKIIVFELAIAEFYTKITGNIPKAGDAEYFVHEGGANQKSPINEKYNYYFKDIEVSRFEYFKSIISNYKTMSNIYNLSPNKRHKNVYRILGFIGENEKLKESLNTHYTHLVKMLIEEKNDRYENYLKEFIPFAKKIADVEYKMPNE